jgi:Rhs element Vgr protein
VLTLIYGSTIIEFEAEMDARNQLSGIKSKSWDYSTQEIIEEEAESPSIVEAGNISSSDLADVIGISEFNQIHTGKVDDQELKAWSDAKALKTSLSKIRGRVRCQGYGNLKPGEMIELKGIGNRFNGKVFVNGIRNQINLKNWETDIQFGLNPEWFSGTKDIIDTNAAGLLPAINGLQIGIVTQLESDPDGEDRILVKMPAINPDDDGTWARISTLDAGENRGSFFRPEIGDEVILGFLNDDPRDAVVLGMLNSSAKPAPLTASDSNPEKGFVTRSELKLIFDDEKKIIHFETPNGNKATLSDDEGSIILEDENGNKITMNSDGISLESAKDIVIKATGDVKVDGVNVELKASAQLKAEGSAGAEVSSSATATLKGSLVQIN